MRIIDQEASLEQITHTIARIGSLETTGRFRDLAGLDSLFNWATQDSIVIEANRLNPKSHATLNSILQILEAHPDWTNDTTTSIPLHTFATSLITIQDRLSHVLTDLTSRERLMQYLDLTHSVTTLAHKPVHIELLPKLATGQVRFQGRIDNIPIGEVDIRLFHNDHLEITEVQKNASYSNHGRRPNPTILRRFRQLVGTDRERKINSKNDTTIPESPGIEELLILLARQVLIKNQSIDQELPILIPHPTETPWGWLEQEKIDITTSITKQALLTSNLETSLRAVIKDVDPRHQTYCQQILGQDLTILETIYQLTPHTTTFLKRFAPYRSIFSDLPHIPNQSGRIIKAHDLDLLPITDLIRNNTL